MKNHFNRLRSFIIPLTLSLHFSAAAITPLTEWSSNEEYSRGSFVIHGDYDGTPLVWSNNRNCTNETPGESGTAWILENRREALSGLPEEWRGWNSDAPIKRITVDNESGAITYNDIGTTGDQLDRSDFSTPAVPTWPRGAEGVYMIIHEGLGELNFETSVLPAIEVGYNHPRIRPSWSIDATQMDEDEWQEARMMYIDGNELLVQQPRLSPFKDQYETYSVGDTLVGERTLPLIPELQGAVVSMTKEATKEMIFKVPSLHYPTNNLAEPDTIWKEITLQVSMNFGNTGTTITVPSEDSVGATKEIPFPGYIHPVSEDMKLPLLIVPAVKEVEAVHAAKLSRLKLNEEIYSLESSRFPKGKQCDYFYSPHVELSEDIRTALRNEGFAGSFSYSEDHRITSADFVHPDHITVEKVLLQDAMGEKVYPENGEMYYEPQSLSRVVADVKGVVIHGMSSIVDIAYWADVHSLYAGSKHALPKSLYNKMYEDIEYLMANHRVSMPQISEVIDHARNRVSGTLSQLRGESQYHGGLSDTLTWNKTVEHETNGDLFVLINPSQQHNYEWGLSRNGKYEDCFSFYLERDEKLQIITHTKPVLSLKYFTDFEQLYLFPIHPGAIGEDSEVKTEVPFAQTNNELSLSLPKGSYKLSLYTPAGRLVQENNIISEGAATSVSLDTFGKGVYVAQLNSGNQSLLTHKITIK